ncbi:MAG TPA: glycoside hydrolase [Verrucomicrobiae bacterium]|nr:glycoside hydrolase [Verrucomicrobiae bacterium]
MAGLLAFYLPAFNGVAATADAWQIENRSLIVTVRPETGVISVKPKDGGHEWSNSAGQGPGPVFRNARKDGSAPRRLVFDAPLRAGNTNRCSLTLSLRERGADLFVAIDLPDRQKSIHDFFPLQPFVLESTNAYLVVADYSDGHLYTLNSKPQRAWFNLWSIDMPWAGVCDLRTGRGYALVVETDDDACIRLVQAPGQQQELWMPQAGFQASQGQFRYPRRFFYHFASSGGYVTLAKRFRQYAREQGLLVTFAEKLKKNPNLTRLFGAPDVWGNASLKFAREAKAAGVEKMIIQGRASAEEMKAINALGFITSEYDNYTDILQVEPGKPIDAHHGHLPQDVVLKADGERMKAWLTWDKKQYMKRCPALWVAAAKVVIPEVLGQYPFLGRFIDVTTAEDLYVCYDPQHPLTRSAKRQCGVHLLGYARSLGLIMGGEHGRYWAVPELDYIEGMQSGGSYSWPSGWLLRPKSKDQQFENPHGGKFGSWAEYETWGIGHATRVPLWELVFHDCVVSTWYWGDSSDFLLEAAPEVTPKKDAFNVLYGTIPLLWANKEGSWQTARETFLRTYRNTCKLHEIVAGTEMLSHEFLTPDRAVQRTRFSDGTEVVVNFGAQPALVKVKGTSWSLPKNGFAVKGPRIEQSLALVDGKVKSRIKTKNFRFSETLPPPRQDAAQTLKPARENNSLLGLAPLAR